MRFESFALSDRGRVRQENEDSSAVFPDRNLFIVADGMGGAAGGKQASETAVETIRDGFEAPRDTDRLVRSILEANRRIFALGRSEASLKGMGTTLVALLVHEDGRSGAIISVGDSRAYRLRGGEFRQLTVDHSLVADLVRRHDISEAEARHHPYRHVLTRALGVQADVEPDVVEIDLAPGDLYVLCSDGVYGMLEPGDLETAVLEASDDVERLCHLLVDRANAAGGKDNATVVAMRCVAD